MKKLILIFLFITHQLVAQGIIPKYGQFSLEELKQASYPKDTTAAALILYDVGRTEFDDKFNIRFLRRLKVKVLNKNGLDWANFVIPLYVKDKYNAESLEEVKAVSFTLENGEVVKRELNRKEIYREKKNEYYDLMRFTVPNVQQGSVFEVEYTFFTPYSSNLPDWQFQYEIPVLWSEYTLYLPPFFDYQMVGTGFQAFHLSEQGINRSERVVGDYRFQESIYKMAMKDVPAFKDEPFITSENDYIAKMDFQLARVNFPSQVKSDYINTWESLVEKLLKDFKIGEYLGDKHGKDEALALTHSIPETEILNKAKAIYQYFQKNFKFDGKKTLTVLTPPKKLMETRKGSCADLHVLLCNMMRHIGIKADLVILSTREHGKINYNYPLLDKFNYVAVIITIGENNYILDATNEYLIFGMLPAECINEMGLVLENLRGKKARFVPLEQPIAYIHRSNLIMKFNQKAKSFDTYASILLSGYAALEARNIQLDEQKVKNALSSVSITQLEIKNIEDITQNVGIKFNTAQELDLESDVLYIDLPLIHPDLKSNPFKRNERAFPIDFNYKREYLYVLNIEIPEGFVYEDSPIEREAQLDNGLVQMKFVTKVFSNNLFQVNFYLKINKPVINQFYYSQIKSIYAQIVNLLEETIVFKKKKE